VSTVFILSHNYSFSISREKDKKFVEFVYTGSIAKDRQVNMGYYWEKGERFYDPCIESDGEDEHYDDDDEENGSPYSFQDSEAFLAALELYNREDGAIRRGRIGVFEGVLTLQRQWECKQVAGSHRTPCGECDEGFEFCRYSSTPSYYLVDKVSAGSTGGRFGEKMCLSCMDTLLHDKYETTDKGTIRSKLIPLRKKQSKLLANTGASDDLDYEKQYLDYPVFLRHCKNNDKEKAEKLDFEYAEQQNAAMNNPCALGIQPRCAKKAKTQC